MNVTGVVFRKEVLDNLRDRRTVLSTLVFGALIGPLVFAGMFNLVLQEEMQKA